MYPPTVVAGPGVEPSVAQPAIVITNKIKTKLFLLLINQAIPKTFERHSKIIQILAKSTISLV